MEVGGSVNDCRFALLPDFVGKQVVSARWIGCVFVSCVPAQTLLDGSVRLGGGCVHWRLINTPQPEYFMFKLLTSFINCFN